MTEQQHYEVVREYPQFELRRYEPHVLAEVQVAGSFGSAGNSAFRPLVSYIGGRNEDSQKFAMTAPVIQTSDERAELHDVSFVMPAGSTLEDMPDPSDPQVHLREVGEEWAAVSRFSGRWTESSFSALARELLDRVAAEGLTVVGPPRFARFDPPWTPWFMRRNEVVVPVAPLAD